MNDDLKVQKRKYRIRLLLLCVGGLAINLAFARIAIWLELPLYLDNVGVILTAALGGYIPAIIVGYLSNVINGIGDPITTYYGTLTVLIAIVAAYVASRGWFRKLKTIVLSILIFAAIGGIAGSLLTWLLYGFDFGSGISAPLSHFVYDHLIHNVFVAQIIGDFLLDILDKAIVMIIVLVVLRFLPEKFKKLFQFGNWKQKPLSEEEKSIVKGKGLRGRSLRSKFILLISIAMVIIAALTTGISFRLFHEETVKEQTEMADSILNVAVDMIDGDKVPEYIAKGRAVEGYDETEAGIRSLQLSSEKVQYVYVYQILEDGCHVVFDLEEDGTSGEEPGAVIDFDQAFAPYLPQLLAGQEIEPVISDETYGWLLTIYKPVYDSNGKCVCYVAADISMDELMSTELGFLAKIISLFLGIFLLIVAIVLNHVDYSTIFPINTMTMAARKFAVDSEEGRKESIKYIEEMDIQTGDEIEDLYHAFSRTTQDMVQYVDDVQEKNATISRMQNNLIEVMADMVESRDQYTGDHVKKTAAYAEIILDEMKKEGIYEDQLTDTFVEDVIHSAPLHDVGKIQVSDTILNKPGKLTDEEFKEMQNHTLAGKEIIESAVDAVSDAGYLNEAKNLATYHHEKWNGKGYPYGISGEEIPLSARVMAVADVFDALVSKRSYKEGFPIEKALDIIREGIGTHFDPMVAQAFLNAEDRVRKVAENHDNASKGTGLSSEQHEGQGKLTGGE